jgi:hypothetical protein
MQWMDDVTCEPDHKWISPRREVLVEIELKVKRLGGPNLAPIPQLP